LKFASNSQLLQQEHEPDIADEPSTGSINDKEPFSVKSSINTTRLSNHKTKKKKKKKNKEDGFSSSQNIGNHLDVMLENLSLEDNSFSSISKAKQTNLEIVDNLRKHGKSSILQGDPKFLSAENELRRIFGSKVVGSFQKSHQAGSSRQVPGGRRGNHKHRRTILVTPSEHWPRWDGSLSMELLETRDGYHYFR